MRRPIYQHPVSPLLGVALVALGLGACGGGSDGDPEPSPTATPSASPEQTAAASPTPTPEPGMQQLVRRVTQGKPTELSGSTAVSAGDTLLMLTRLSDQDPIAGERLRIALPARPAKRLKIRADGPGKLRSVADVRSRSGKRVALTGLKYTCMQPGATFCPVELRRRGGTFTATLDVPAGRAPVALVAQVAKPKDLTEPVTLPRGSAAPAVEAQLRAIGPGQSAELSATVTAGPGTTVQLVPTFTNLDSSAGNRFGLTIPRAAGEELTVGAGPAAAASSSTATIAGADGKSIKVDGLRYTCVAEPEGYCPLKVDETDERYVLRGTVPTGRVAVVISLTLAAG